MNTSETAKTESETPAEQDPRKDPNFTGWLVRHPSMEEHRAAKTWPRRLIRREMRLAELRKKRMKVDRNTPAFTTGQVHKIMRTEKVSHDVASDRLISRYLNSEGLA